LLLLILSMNDSILSSADRELLIKLRSLKFDAKSDKFSPCFFAAGANSLDESNSELSSPILNSLTIALSVPSPMLLSIAILALRKPLSHCCMSVVYTVFLR
jgi:hypothetical protein